MSICFLQCHCEHHRRIEHEDCHRGLSPPFLAQRLDRRVVEVDAASREALAKRDKTSHSRACGCSVQFRLWNQARHRAATARDDNLFASLNTVEQFGQPRLGTVRPDRGQDFVHVADIDRSADQSK